MQVILNIYKGRKKKMEFVSSHILNRTAYKQQQQFSVSLPCTHFRHFIDTFMLRRILPKLKIPALDLKIWFEGHTCIEIRHIFFYSQSYNTYEYIEH